MDQKALFQQLLSFVAAVSQTKHDLSKNIPIEYLTPAQYGILELVAFDQPVTLSEISDCRDMSMPNASRELKKLLDKELCIKYSAPEDRRKQYICLSPQGEQLMEGVLAHIGGQVSERLKGADGEQLRQISSAMELLQKTVFRTKE